MSVSITPRPDRLAVFRPDEPELLGAARLATVFGLSVGGGLSAMSRVSLTSEQSAVLATHRAVIDLMTPTVTLAVCRTCAAWRLARPDGPIPVCHEGDKHGRMVVAKGKVRDGNADPAVAA